MIKKQEIIDRIDNLWPQKEKIKISSAEKLYYKTKIKFLLKKHNACLISHYYVDEDIQKLTEETGGMLGDSLAMANFAYKHKAKTIVVSGVRFMGETAKILSPNKKVIMPTLKSECSLDISCNITDFRSFINNNPNRSIVVYVNTSAKIKAMADWIVTSSNALKICTYLKHQGKKILWAPDKYLGKWIEDQTKADMKHYNGFCVVHEEFKINSLKKMKTKYPEAAILVHPESPKEVIDIADVVGSTSTLLKKSVTLKNKICIVATDAGIFYKMKLMSPNKIFISAPTGGVSAACKSCAHCPWMGMNNLKNLANTLEDQKNEIFVSEDIIKKASVPLNKMLNFM